ncbi:Deoxynucleotidyltransferase terminal-interacting protein 2 [Orchesella cincta]|uniref:Deoxynucleotidyltransferase terminal-interacting protein 2 n=1 Tax=Orchesella cincta TaxID=48709 RepID=A0A1D2N9L5_ORCCI|nr:Deoxynucleotidyltransferase terminal-interacting protein 2 [Orchesella cincta]
MSLFGRKDFKKLADAASGRRGGKKNEKSLSKRPTKPKIFQIAETPLGIDAPFLGGDSSGSGSFNFLSSLDSDSLFGPTESSLYSPLSTGSSKVSGGGGRNKIVEAALASSKLSTLTSEGPIEPSPRLGKRKLKAAKKHAKSLTKGSAWFNMAKQEITKEKKNDLEALKMRSAMEGIHHYKRNNMTHTPKYFHVGTVVESKADFYASRIPKKQRKSTLAQEFAADFGMD